MKIDLLNSHSQHRIIGLVYPSTETNLVAEPAETMEYIPESQPIQKIPSSDHITPLEHPETNAEMPRESESKQRNRVTNEYGFLVEPDNETLQPSSLQKRQTIKALESDFLRLLNMGKDWQLVRKKNKKKLRKLCRLGIPESLRAQVWSKLAGVDNLRQSGLFQELMVRQDKEDIPIFEIIERDIHRCYPDHVLFKEVDGEGQKNLRYVLRAYALYNPEVEYCQGMGFLVGLMLMHMPSESKSEIQPILFITQWFITFFTCALPWETVLRVWDMFYYDGIKAFFRVALAIMKSCEGHILKECPSPTDVLDFMLHIPYKPYLEAENLIKIALKIKISTSEINSLRLKETTNYRRSRSLGNI